MTRKEGKNIDMDIDYVSKITAEKIKEYCPLSELKIEELQNMYCVVFNSQKGRKAFCVDKRAYAIPKVSLVKKYLKNEQRSS